MGGTAPPRCIRCSATSTGPWWRGQCESTNALAVTRHGQVSSWRPYQGRTRVSSRTGGKERSARLPDGSCVRRESHAQFFERPEVKSPRPTHLGGLMGTTSGVAGGLAATDPKLVPYGTMTATFYTGLGCLMGPSVLFIATRAL